MPRLDVEAIRREQIVAAALAVLARRGFEGATMREIATAAGASTGMVTYHFASKEDVLRAALEEVAARFGRAVDAAVEGIEEPRAALLALLDACVPDGPEGARAQVLWAEVWARAARSAELRAAHADLYAGWRRRLARAVRVGRASGAFRAVDEETWAADAAALLDGLALHVLLHPAVATPATMRDAIRRHVAATLDVRA